MSKDLIILHGEVKTPPVSAEARYEIGSLLRDLQDGELLSMPQSRPMPTVGTACHELRVRDADLNWRVMYHVTAQEIVILDVFAKKTEQTPQSVIDTCKTRLATYIAQKQAAAQKQKGKRK